MRDYKILTIGTVVSILVVVILGWLQSIEATVLNLAPQWLALAILPIVVALFAGGFVTSFKGFGVELETQLQAPVGSLDLTASDAIADVTGDEKQSISYLENLPLDKKLRVRWLLFVHGRKAYYTTYGIRQYVESLPNIEYFEVRDEFGEFVCFLPISLFRDSSRPEYDQILDDNIATFVSAIEEERVADTFSRDAVTLSVSSKLSLVEVLKILRDHRVNFAAVTSPEGKYIGVIFVSDVEKRIADAVLYSNRVTV